MWTFRRGREMWLFYQLKWTTEVGWPDESYGTLILTADQFIDSQ